MTPAERRELLAGLPPGMSFIPCRLGKRHRRAFGYDLFPVAYGLGTDKAVRPGNILGTADGRCYFGCRLKDCPRELDRLARMFPDSPDTSENVS